MLRHNPIAKLLKNSLFKQKIVKSKKKYSRKETSNKDWLKGYWEWKNKNEDSN
tara:strand:- start:1260 stop:1418 length:159 start_codon:yes stop_codon:yes gene_type:complete